MCRDIYAYICVTSDSVIYTCIYKSHICININWYVCTYAHMCIFSIHIYVCSCKYCGVNRNLSWRSQYLVWQRTSYRHCEYAFLQHFVRNFPNEFNSWTHVFESNSFSRPSQVWLLISDLIFHNSNKCQLDAIYIGSWTRFTLVAELLFEVENPTIFPLLL